MCKNIEKSKSQEYTNEEMYDVCAKCTEVQERLYVSLPSN